MTCTHCQCAEKLFDDKGARKELKSYHKKGPKKVTRKLIELLLPRTKAGQSLLDIGGGIGAIQLALMEAGAEKVTDVDASAGYLSVAEEEAKRKGFGDRVSYRHGDFVDLSGGIAQHDIVTLDKVICCYPDYRALLETAAQKAGKTLAVVFPRDMWLVKVVMGMGNLWLRFRGSAFRVYPHPSAQVFQLIEAQGLKRVATDHHRAWQIVVFERE